MESFLSFSGCFRPSLIAGLPVCLHVQDLTEAIPIQEVVMCRVNSAGEDICRLSTPDDASRLQTQLKFLNARWANVCQQLNEQKRRCVCERLRVKENPRASVSSEFLILILLLFCLFLSISSYQEILMKALK